MLQVINLAEQQAARYGINSQIEKEDEKSSADGITGWKHLSRHSLYCPRLNI
jgi:hypothetical protein